jgi:hypothetical protein
VAAGSRVTRGGQLLRWRLAGIDQAAAEAMLPFFIEWDTGCRCQAAARQPTASPASTSRSWQLGGDPDRLDAWLGAHHLPITVHPGPPALTNVILTGAVGEIVLNAELL